MWAAFKDVKRDEKLNRHQNLEKILKKYEHELKISQNKYDNKKLKMNSTDERMLGESPFWI